MATYVIGDVQGCYRSLQALLEKINFSNRDTLWFVGDLVNRGHQSLETLDFIMSLEDQAVSILGNHDLYLLALHYKAWPPRPLHTLNTILQHPQVDRYVEWLKRLPLVHVDRDKQCAMIHAGLYPLWTLEQAETLGKEVSAHLQNDRCISLLEAMYGNTPNRWTDDMPEHGRCRFIVNAMTRMRYVDETGRLDLHHKEAPQYSPEALYPWFEHPKLQIPRGMTLCFGHWASLGGKSTHAQVIATDTGCVWGEQLSAYCIETKTFISIPSQENQASS